MLRFTPTAWAKLLFLRDAGATEVGGFGIAASDDYLLVTDFQLIKQESSCVSVDFMDSAVAEYFDEQVDRGLHPSRFARLWIHTHPGDSPHPSGTDEETFARVFGHCDWAVMFILARGGQTYCRLEHNVGPASAVELPVEVDYRQPFAASDHAAWLAQYQTNVVELVWDIGQPAESGAANGQVIEGLRFDRDSERTLLASDAWLDDRQRRWHEELAWDDYLHAYDEDTYEYSLD